MDTYELISSTRLPEPVHGMAFNPWDAGELACVGQGTLTLWRLQQHGDDVSFQVPGCRGGFGVRDLAGPRDITDLHCPESL